MENNGRAHLVDGEIARLRSFAPFDRMARPLLEQVVLSARLTFHRVGETICHPDVAEDGRSLWIVRSGGVRASGRCDDARERREETLGTGTIFPLESVVSDRAPSRIYTAAQDAFIWRLEGGAMDALMDDAAFLRWLAVRLQEDNDELRAATAECARARQASDQALALPVSAVGSADVECVAADAAVGEIAAVMAARGIGSVLVGSRDAVVGIVTKGDLVRRGLAAGLDAATAADVMSPNPHGIEDTATVMGAAIEMERRGLRHLPILGPDGAAVGIVSERDLFLAQRQGIEYLHSPIDAADSIEEVVRLAGHMRSLAIRMFRQGMAVAQFMRLMSSISDRLTCRLLRLIAGEEVMRRICWLAFGSEGREEQGFVTDQDNGVIFAVRPGEDVEAQRAAVLDIARRMNEALHAAGFERCRGDIMAGNPEWCLTLDEWQDKFSGWIRSTTPTALLNATIFFDLRPVGGLEDLAKRLLDHLADELRGNTILLHMLAKNALDVAPPIGALSRFKTGRGAQRGTLDVKTQGTRLFVDVARIYALANRLRTSNTEQRLLAMGRRIRRSFSAVEADVAAWRHLQQLRLRRQLQSLEDGGDPNRLDPYALNDFDQRMLREALRRAESLQDRLRMDYQ